MILDASQPLPTIKAQIPAYLDPARSAIERQAKVDQAQARDEQPGLWKRTVKWSLGALIAAVIGLRIWQGTRWARKKSYFMS